MRQLQTLRKIEIELDKKTGHTREKGSEQANGQLCIGNQDILFHIHHTNMLT